MNGDVLGNYGVIFSHGRHKPLGVIMPSWGIDWSGKTFQQCNHHPPTREVVRLQFVPRVKSLVNFCFGNSISRPEFLLTLTPYESLGFDYGSEELYRSLLVNFPQIALEIPAKLCRNGAEDNLTLYSTR